MFIYALIGVYLITPIIRKWIKNASQKEILYFLIIWIFTLMLAIPGLKIYFPKIDFTYFSGFIGYFVLGYYLSQIDTKGKGIPILLVLSGIFITIFGTYFFTIQNMEFYDYFYEYLTLNVLMVSSGLFLLFNKSVGPNERINSITFKLNQSCFGIYLIHPLVLRLFKIIGFDGLMSSPILSIFLVSIICFICSFFLISFVKKLKFGFLTS